MSNSQLLNLIITLALVINVNGIRIYNALVTSDQELIPSRQVAGSATGIYILPTLHKQTKTEYLPEEKNDYYEANQAQESQWNEHKFNIDHYEHSQYSNNYQQEITNIDVSTNRPHWISQTTEKLNPIHDKSKQQIQTQQYWKHNYDNQGRQSNIKSHLNFPIIPNRNPV